MSEPVTQALGEAGEPCRGCGSPLAADQRYCLNCGERRAGPRIDFREHLSGRDAAAQQDGAPASEASVAATSPAERSSQRDFAPLAAVGGIAVLGLMLLVGVLIGKGSGTTTTSAPAPVVRVGDGGSTESAAAGKEKDGESQPEPKTAKAKPSEKATSGQDLVSGKNGGGPVEASDQALRELEEANPEEYSKNSAKLPDEIATGGPPPPKDNKAPGGGSKGTAIE